MGWKCLSSPFRHIGRFGTLAFWHIGPFRGKGPGGFLSPTEVAPGTVLGLACPLFPPLLSLYHHYGYFSRGGGVMTPPSCPGLCFQWGSHLFAPISSSSPPGGAGGTPGRTSLGLSPSSGQYVFCRILMKILYGPCLEFPHHWAPYHGSGGYFLKVVLPPS